MGAHPPSALLGVQCVRGREPRNTLEGWSFPRKRGAWGDWHPPIITFIRPIVNMMTEYSAETKEEYRSQAIRFWERGRLWYLGLLALSSLTGLMLISTMQRFQWTCLIEPVVVVEGILCFIGTNICYTFGDVPELLVMGGPLEAHYRRYRKLLWLAGTLLSMLLAFVSTMAMVRFACGF